MSTLRSLGQGRGQDAQSGENQGASAGQGGRSPNGQGGGAGLGEGSRETGSGRTVQTQGEEEDLSGRPGHGPTLEREQLQGAPVKTRGALIPAIDLPPGYAEAVEEALTETRIPREYSERVRRYFGGDR